MFSSWAGHGCLDRCVSLMHQRRILQFCHDSSPSLLLNASRMVVVTHSLCRQSPQRRLPCYSLGQGMRQARSGCHVCVVLFLWVPCWLLVGCTLRSYYTHIDNQEP